MKTIETINSLCKIDRSYYRAERDNLLNNISTFDKCVNEAVCNGSSVRESMKSFIKEVGRNTAEQTVASLINRSAWDGRISNRNAAWARTIDSAWDEEAMTRMYASTKVHMTHLDQAADYIRRSMDELVAEIEAEEAEQNTITEEAINEAVVEDVQKEIDTMKQNAEQTIEAIRAEVTKRTGRSAWSKGVTQYAMELIDEIEQGIMDGYFDADDLVAPKLVERQMLNGADSWNQYSWGGCSLIYDGQIAERLCNPTELKRTRNGQRRPNATEEWLGTQARALFQASELVKAVVAYVCC